MQREIIFTLNHIKKRVKKFVAASVCLNTPEVYDSAEWQVFVNGDPVGESSRSFSKAIANASLSSKLRTIAGYSDVDDLWVDYTAY